MTPFATTRPRLKELLLGAAPKTLREARVLWTHLEARWVLWVEEQGHEIAEGEGLVALTDARDGDHDGPHKAGGAHYLGTGSDENLYLEGIYIADGNHPFWIKAGEKWEGMHPSCRWGGRWQDANHLGIAWAGRA